MKFMNIHITQQILINKTGANVNEKEKYNKSQEKNRGKKLKYH